MSVAYSIDEKQEMTLNGVLMTFIVLCGQVNQKW